MKSLKIMVVLLSLLFALWVGLGIYIAKDNDGKLVIKDSVGMFHKPNMNDEGTPPSVKEYNSKLYDVSDELSVYKIVDCSTAYNANVGTFYTVATYVDEDGTIKSKNITDAHTIETIDSVKGNYLVIKKFGSKEYLYILKPEVALSLIS